MLLRSLGLTCTVLRVLTPLFSLLLLLRVIGGADRRSLRGLLEFLHQLFHQLLGAAGTAACSFAFAAAATRAALAVLLGLVLDKLRPAASDVIELFDVTRLGGLCLDPQLAKLVEEVDAKLARDDPLD